MSAQFCLRVIRDFWVGAGIVGIFEVASSLNCIVWCRMWYTSTCVCYSVRLGTFRGKQCIVILWPCKQCNQYPWHCEYIKKSSTINEAVNTYLNDIVHVIFLSLWRLKFHWLDFPYKAGLLQSYSPLQRQSRKPMRWIFCQGILITQQQCWQHGAIGSAGAVP